MNIRNCFTRFVATLALAVFLSATSSSVVLANEASLKREEKIELQRSLRAQSVQSSQFLKKEFEKLRKENDAKQSALKEDFDQQIKSAADVAAKRSLMAEYRRQDYALRAELANQRAAAKDKANDALLITKEQIYQNYGISGAVTK